VDDIKESDNYGNFNLSKYLFASCWTDSEEENLALWSMYSKNNSGIIISLPKDPFLYKELEPPPILKNSFLGKLQSLLPIEELFTKEYILNPLCLHKDCFIRKIEYVSETKLREIRGEAICFKEDPANLYKLQVYEPSELAGYKLDLWSFQREIRYILMILPCLPLPINNMLVGKWISDLSQYMIKSIKEGKDIGLDYLDINLDPNALDQIKIILNPSATEPEKITVDALLEKYTNGGSSSYSNLSSQIRQNKN
jgi:hypothetical protein